MSGCCNNQPDPDVIRAKVQEGYAQIARSTGGNQYASTQKSCCGCGPNDADALARQIGYTAKELANLPEEANLGLSCGNPTVIASLRPGEVVLDLGSGAGFDAFLAGPRVGPKGRVIGVDMTPDMLSKARSNNTIYRQRTGLDNVEFRLGEIEHLPVPDNSIDVVISNCVINLSPNKAQVWKEIARVLRSGGRAAVSDLALLKPLPPAIVAMTQALVGCIAGAVLIEETRRMIAEAGLVDAEVECKPEYVRAMESVQDPLYREIIRHLPTGSCPADYITSLNIKVRKKG